MKVITEWKYVGPPGAAPPTLEKRAKYRGSRKARRARQRVGRPHAYVSTIRLMFEPGDSPGLDGVIAMAEAIKARDATPTGSEADHG